MNQYNEHVHRAKDNSEIHKLVKNLICDYLVKNEYKETLEMFKREAQVEAEASKTDFSSLVELISMLTKIIDTRCGRLKVGADIYRIEAIMMKIITEKQRCMQIISTSKPGAFHDPRPMRAPVEYERRGSPTHARGPGDAQHGLYVRQRLAQRVSFPQQETSLENSNFKLIKTLKVHQSKIHCSALAPRALILFTGGLDLTMSIVNLKTYEYSIEKFHKAIRLCKVRELSGEIVVGVGFLDQELQLFRCLGDRKLQHINGIQTPGAAITAFDFSDTNLYTADADGKLVIWTIHGKFVSMHQSSPKIVDICHFMPNNLIINESHKISVLNLATYETAKVVMNSGANYVKRCDSMLVIVNQNVVNIYNQSYERIDFFEFQKNVKAATWVSGNIVVGYENSICLNGQMTTSLKIHTTPLSTLDLFSMADIPYLVSGSCDGELKICELIGCI